jgi:hypothetical protein
LDRVLASTPCHLKPYVRPSRRRLSDYLRSTACKAVDLVVTLDRSAAGRSGVRTPVEVALAVGIGNPPTAITSLSLE